jgi:hypothetical protein
VRLDKSPEIVRVPLRLERKYSESINGVSYSVVETTDWTSFVMGKPAPLLFQYPPRCANSDPAALQQRIVLPAVSASAQSSLQIPPTTARIPTLPDQFTMTMEAKPHEDNDDDDESVSTVVWTLDVPNRKERLDVYSLLYVKYCFSSIFCACDVAVLLQCFTAVRKTSRIRQRLSTRTFTSMRQTPLGALSALFTLVIWGRMLPSSPIAWFLKSIVCVN